MLIDNKVILDEFVQKHAKAVKPLNKWLKEVAEAQWSSHNELKRCFPTADYVKNGRYVFNIGGNNYRIVAVVMFINGIMILKFVGTHAEYDKIKDCSVI
ncbi:MAG: type II toxin-antitoxin system HigB family toxin [bacterium]|nr:type II toxin-antitoxin system HigB family toxin [bacterium]